MEHWLITGMETVAANAEEASVKAGGVSFWSILLWILALAVAAAVVFIWLRNGRGKKGTRSNLSPRGIIRGFTQRFGKTESNESPVVKKMEGNGKTKGRKGDKQHTPVQYVTEEKEKIATQKPVPPAPSPEPKRTTSDGTKPVTNPQNRLVADYQASLAELQSARTDGLYRRLFADVTNSVQRMLGYAQRGMAADDPEARRNRVQYYFGANLDNKIVNNGFRLADGTLKTDRKADLDERIPSAEQLAGRTAANRAEVRSLADAKAYRRVCDSLAPVLQAFSQAEGDEKALRGVLEKACVVYKTEGFFFVNEGDAAGDVAGAFGNANDGGYPALFRRGKDASEAASLVLVGHRAPQA